MNRRKSHRRLLPNAYVRLDREMLERVGRHVEEMQRNEEVYLVTQSAALRDLIRRGLDAADVEHGRRARRRR